jgi:hypothetical protein
MSLTETMLRVKDAERRYGDARDTIDNLLAMPERIRLAEVAVIEAEACLRQYKDQDVAAAQQAVDSEMLVLTMSAPDEVYTGKNEPIRKAAMERHIHDNGRALRTAEAELATRQSVQATYEVAVESAKVDAKAVVNLFAALRHVAQLQTAILRLYALTDDTNNTETF